MRLVDAGAAGRRLQRQPRLRHPARVRLPACWSGRACTSAPPSPTSDGRWCSVTSPSTPSPTSSRLSPPTPSGATERTHAGVLRAAMARVRADAARPWRPHGRHGARLRAGRDHAASPSATSPWVASPAVPPEVFAGVDYTALGHLHGRQEVADGRALQRLARGHVVLRVAAHQGQPARRPLRGRRSSSSTSRRRSSGRWPCFAAPSRSCSRDPSHAAAEAAWCQVTLTDARASPRRHGPGAAPLPAHPGAAVRPRGGKRAAASVRRPRRDPLRRRGLLRLPRPRPRWPGRHRGRAVPCSARPSRRAGSTGGSAMTKGWRGR